MDYPVQIRALIEGHGAVWPLAKVLKQTDKMALLTVRPTRADEENRA
jgi:hypothetical protein